VPTCEPGRILGHEGVGIIEKVGPAVTAFKPGTGVLISCNHRLRQMRLLPQTDVFALQNRRLDSRATRSTGRRPSLFAFPMPDTSLYPIPEDADEEALVMPERYSARPASNAACSTGKVLNPGGSVAIVGSGTDRPGGAVDRPSSIRPPRSS